MVQALAFAELLAGGLFLVSAIENIGLGELVKHGLKGAKLTSGTAGGGTTTTAGFTGGTAGSAGAGGGSGSSPSFGGLTGGVTAPAPGKAGETIYPSGKVKDIGKVEKELETYLKRPLTAKEKKEVVAAEGNV